MHKNNLEECTTELTFAVDILSFSDQRGKKCKVKSMHLVSSHLSSFSSLMSFYPPFLFLLLSCFHLVRVQVYIFVYIKLQKQVHDCRYMMSALAPLDPGKPLACLPLLLDYKLPEDTGV